MRIYLIGGRYDGSYIVIRGPKWEPGQIVEFNGVPYVFGYQQGGKPVFTFKESK